MISVKLVFCLLFSFSSSIRGQFFDPELDDQVYLDNTRDKVNHEVGLVSKELIDQAEIVREATRAFIGAKIKENLFKALRILAEKELESLSMQDRPRQPRQDEDEDAGETTTERGLIPQLATIVKTIFGGNVNVTKYVESASKLLPRPIGNQIVGVVSLLDPSQFTTTTAPRIILASAASPAPVNVTVVIPQYGPGVGGQGSQATETEPPAGITTSPSPSGGDEDDDDNVPRRQTGRQLNPMDIINGVEYFWKSFQNSSLTVTASPVVKQSYTTPEELFDDDYTTPPSINKVAQGIQTSVSDLRKGVPDLFQGAREAYGFLATVSTFLDKWNARLAAGSVDPEDREE